MTARSRMILAIAGVLIVCVLFFFLFIRARQGELASVRTDIEAEENRALQLTTELNRLKDLQERAPELQAELAKIRELVPQQHEVPHFLFLIQDAATESGVNFLNITPELPKPPPEQAPLAEVRMSISAEGGYFSIQDFVRRLQELDRATRIDTLSLSGEAAEGTVLISLEISARVFFELPAPPAPEADTSGGIAPPTTPVSGASASPAPAGTP